jgi:hypothetical protein
MSLTKSQANTQATAAQTAGQSALDSSFIVDADILIANAIAHGLLKVNLTLVKGVSASNVSDYYKALGYFPLITFADNYGYDSIAYNGLGDGYQSDNQNLDQPVNLFGKFYEQYFDGTYPSNVICDGIKPLYVYLSWS